MEQQQPYVVFYCAVRAHMSHRCNRLRGHAHAMLMLHLWDLSSGDAYAMGVCVCFFSSHEWHPLCLYDKSRWFDVDN